MKSFGTYYIEQTQFNTYQDAHRIYVLRKIGKHSLTPYKYSRKFVQRYRTVAA